MVSKMLKAIVGRVQGLHKAAFWLASFSFLSQILAFLRDRILAHFFGAGRELDIYYASFEVPDLLFTTIASLVSASILVPLLAKWEEEKSENQHENLDSIFTAFFMLLILFSLLAFIFMPYLVPLFFKGFNTGELAKIVSFSRVLLLSPLFLGLSNFFSSITQYEKRFLLYSVSPLLYNAGIIGGALFGAGKFGVAAVVAGVCFGALAHMALQFGWVFFSGGAPKLIRAVKWSEVAKTFSLSIPRTVSLSASSLVGLIFIAIASNFPEGSIAAYTFAFNLQSVPLVIIGASYSLAAFPTLAAHFVKKEVDLLCECLGSGLSHIILWSLPISAVFIVLRAHIVRTVLGTGAFDWSDTRITALLLSVFVASIVFQSIQLFLTRAHYAFGNTRTPLAVNVSGAAVTVGLAVVFADYFKNEGAVFSGLAQVLNAGGLERLITLTLPAAFSIGALFSAALLWFSLEEEIKTKVRSRVARTSIEALPASLIVGFATWAALRVTDNIFSLDSAPDVFASGATAGIFGILAGLIFLRIIGNREVGEILGRFRSVGRRVS